MKIISVLIDPTRQRYRVHCLCEGEVVWSFVADFDVAHDFIAIPEYKGTEAH